MSPIPVIYDDRIGWKSFHTKGSNRPYCRITVHNGPGNGGQDLWGLLDTGADYLMLETRVARALGINLSGCPKVQVVVASGAIIALPKKAVEITIRQKRVSVDAIFGIQGNALIGRLAILKAIDFGVDINGWLYKVI